LCLCNQQLCPKLCKKFNLLSGLKEIDWIKETGMIGGPVSKLLKTFSNVFQFLG
jgi:hypothetical protein